MTLDVEGRRRPDTRRLALWSVGVFVLASCARLAFQAGIVGMQEPPRDDASQYDALARSLARGGPYLTDDGDRSHRAPAYPAYLAAVYRVFGPSWAAGRIGQVVVSASTCVILLWMGARYLGFPVGLGAALASAVFPYSVFWSGYLLSEPLCAFAATGCTWALLKADEDWPKTAIWSALCALAALARPNMGLLLLLGLIWLLRRPPRRFRRCVLAFAVFGLALLPWTLRNYAVHHRFVPITTMGGVVLWEGNNPYVAADPHMRGRSWHAGSLPEARLVAGLPEAETDSAYFGLALRFMREHWRDMPGLVAWKLMRLWNPWPELPSRPERLLAALTLIPVIVLFAIGLGMAARRRDARIVPLLLPVLAVCLTAAIYWGDARIRSPADPMILLVAAYGAVSLSGGAAWRSDAPASPGAG